MSKDRTRNRKINNPKRVILISCEGDNKTEKTYFNNFIDRDKNYIINYCLGNETDPVNLVKNTIKEVKRSELKLKENDKAYCVFDTDISQERNIQIEKAKKLANKNKIKIITSSPSIEIWFLIHYIYTTKYFTNEEVIKNLKKYCKNYDKNYDIYPSIRNKTQTAIKNAKKLEQFQTENGKELQTIESNPHSQIYEIIEELEKEI